MFKLMKSYLSGSGLALWLPKGQGPWNTFLCDHHACTCMHTYTHSHILHRVRYMQVLSNHAWLSSELLRVGKQDVNLQHFRLHTNQLQLLLNHKVVSWLFATPWTAARQASLSFTISWSLPKFMPTESVMTSKHLILCHPLLLPSILPSIRVFSNESAVCIRWPKYWSFSFSISLSSEYSGLISFNIDWLDFLAFQL